ncbi:MAG: PIN domain-containing protein [Luteimonas sp.]
MKHNFVLVDFENVQPQNLGLLKAGPFHIKVFLGASQSRITLELARALQEFGSDAEYVQVTGNGSNALDFHIAFYIGRLSAAHPDADFTIVSKDTGFDPLVRHLATLGIACRRVKAVTDIGQVKATVIAAPRTPAKTTARAPARSPAKAARNVTVTVLQEPSGPAPKPARKAAPRAGPASGTKAASKPAPARVEEVLARLAKLKTARPGTLKTLSSSLLSWFKPAINEVELAALLAHLARTGKIKVSGTRVSYKLD